MVLQYASSKVTGEPPYPQWIARPWVMQVCVFWEVNLAVIFCLVAAQTWLAGVWEFRLYINRSQDKQRHRALSEWIYRFGIRTTLILSRSWYLLETRIASLIRSMAISMSREPECKKDSGGRERRILKVNFASMRCCWDNVSFNRFHRSESRVSSKIETPGRKFNESWIVESDGGEIDIRNKRANVANAVSSVPPATSARSSGWFKSEKKHRTLRSLGKSPRSKVATSGSLGRLWLARVNN